MGDFAPGSRLHLAHLARELEVSLGVVREAVTRLASEELVTATPQQGFRVRPLSVADLLDLTRARIAIESIVLKESVAQGPLSWEASLVAAYHTLTSTPARVEGHTMNPDWMRAHSEFHRALASACSSPTMLRIRQELFDGSEIYRAWSSRAPEVKPVAPEQHRTLLDAALAHDADRVVEVMTEHIEMTAHNLVASYQSGEDTEVSEALTE